MLYAYQGEWLCGEKLNYSFNRTRCYASSPFSLLATDQSALTGQTTTRLCRSIVKWCVYRICACKPHFLTRISPPKLGCGKCTEYNVLLTTEPTTPVLYVVKPPVETASVWDCYLARYCTRANAPTSYRRIGIFWLYESSRHHRFREVGRPWHH
jgi:hypothetical protein